MGDPKKSVTELPLSMELEVEKSAATDFFVAEEESHCHSSDVLYEESLRRKRRQEKEGFAVRRVF